MEMRGMQATLRALVQVRDGGRRTVQREIMRSTLNVHRGAKENLQEMVYAQPQRGDYLRSGRLLNSIAWEISSDGMEGVVGTNLEYAPYVHHGANGVPEKPYLFNAFEQEWPQLIRRLRAELGSDFVRADHG
jgi:phage gpG-like protein